MKIAKKTIDEIFSLVVIEEVISDFVDLKKTGANFKGLSPFNEEKTPSFVVSPSKEIWKDFSSGKGGNVISFLMEHEQYSYPEALLYLAKKYNINIEYETFDPGSQKIKTEREATILVLNFVKKIFCKKLKEKGSKALSYLHSRGFDNDIIEEFEIGFSPSKDSSIVSDVVASGYQIEYLKKARIINEKKQNRFQGRLIFPIHNITGQVVGFGGRILDLNSKKAKYLNSESSELYQKSKLLYGLHLAKKHIKIKDCCYLVEGYTDVIALHQFGYRNVVANCGTALTKDQVRLVKRFTNNIVILFDSDNAGSNATIKAIDVILEQNMLPKILQLPHGEDPASFTFQNSHEVVVSYFAKNTIDFIDFKNNVLSQIDTTEAIQITKGILYSISLIQDQIAQAYCVRRAAKVLNIEESNLLNELHKIKTKSQNLYRKTKNSLQIKDEKSSLKSKNIEEYQLVRLLINYGSEMINFDKDKTVSEFIVSELERDGIYLVEPLLKKIYDFIKENLESNSPLSKDDYLTHANIEVRTFASYIIGQDHVLGNWQQKDIIVLEEKDRLLAITKEAILRFKLKRVKEMVSASLLRLKNYKDDNESVIMHFSRLSNLEKKIQQELGRLF